MYGPWTTNRRIRPQGVRERWSIRPAHASDAQHMEITTSASRIPGVPSKSWENPPRPKPTYASDNECAGLLAALLRRIPAQLSEAGASSFPLLSALRDLDAIRDSDVAHRLVLVAAATHRTADERRTAEYLLRNRRTVDHGGQSALDLLLAARCAAEMDVRRVQLREQPVRRETLAKRPEEQLTTRNDDPSVGEMVLAKLQAAIDRVPISTCTADRILDAVAIALDLAERHGLNRGKGPSLLAMRADVRKEARLVTHLRDAYGNQAAAASVARLLVGPDHTPIETALLWWCARSQFCVSDVPPAVRARWARNLRTAQAHFAAMPLAPCPHAVIHRQTLLNSLPSLGVSA